MRIYLACVPSESHVGLLDKTKVKHRLHSFFYLKGLKKENLDKLILDKGGKKDECEDK